MFPVYNRYNYHPQFRNGVKGPNNEDERNILPFLVGAAIGLPIGLIASNNNKANYPYQPMPYAQPYGYPQTYGYPQPMPYQPYPIQYY
ncbi:MAG: hypothetical protein J6R47_02620 [Acholeplasmatales bacterium]|nr:hypothetical protein [Acholeplasmatales bacterium]